jgi:SAM-dependent methyltransferase
LLQDKQNNDRTESRDPGKTSALKSDVSFDDYVETYRAEIEDSIGFIGQDVDFFLEIKAEMLLRIAEKKLGPLDKVKVLDIGSGIGLVDKFLKGRIPGLHGVDVEEGVVQKAKINNPEVNYQKYDGERLPFDDNTFDMCFAINVMHHVPPALWENFSREMNRVLKPGGIAAVFEHNPLNPLTRIAVARCEFDRDAVLLKHSKLISLFRGAGFEEAEDAYIVFFPFKAKFFRGIEKALGWLPLGAQHYVTGRKK